MARFVAIGFTIVLTFAVLSNCCEAAQASGGKPSASNEVARMIEAAKQEGRLAVYGQSSLKLEGFNELMVAYNKKYGFNLKTQIVRGGGQTRDTAKLITELATGNPPSWDVHIMLDTFCLYQAENTALEPFNYTGVFNIDPKVIQPGTNGTALVVSQDVVLPSYNSKLVSADDVPKKWDDILDPRWKGKIGVSTATNHWARLAQVWGEQKTGEFVKRLAAQKPSLASTPGVPRAVASGEIMIGATTHSNYVVEAKRTGAPLGFAMKVNPVIVTDWVVAVVKRTKSPNAARLFVAFMMTDEARQIYDKWHDTGSIFIPGSIHYDSVQGKQVLRLVPEFASKLADLDKEYAKMLGFQ